MKIIAPAVIVTDMKSYECNNDDKLRLLEEYGFNNKALNARIINRFYRSENDWGRVIDILCRKASIFEHRLKQRGFNNRKNWKLEKLEKKLKYNQKKANHLAVKIEKLTERIDRIKQVTLEARDSEKWNNRRCCRHKNNRVRTERKQCKRVDKETKCCNSDRKDKIKVWKAEKEARKADREKIRADKETKCCNSDRKDKTKVWKAEKEARKADKEKIRAEKESRKVDKQADKEARKADKEKIRAEKEERRAEKEAKRRERADRKKCYS